MANISVPKSHDSHSIDLVSSEFQKILLDVVNVYESRLAAMEEAMEETLDDVRNEAETLRVLNRCSRCSVPTPAPRDAPNRR